MITQWSVAGMFAVMLAVLLAVVRSNGKRAEQLRAMRETAEREAKERERANKIINNVDNMPVADVRARLRSISENYKRNRV